jgi:DNA polymerase-3 subunit delta'
VGELLPTIRSRCMVLPLKSLAVQQIENYLGERRSDWQPQQRALVARLSEGAVGRARNFDLAAYSATRGQALTILRTALRAGEHTELFKITETYRAGAEGREKIELLLRCLYALLQDLLFLDAKLPELVRNTDVLAELQRLSEAADFQWLASTASRLAEVERGLRRNLLRSLSLDAFEAAIEKN